MTAEIAPQDARRFGSLMSFVELSARSGSRWCPLVTDPPAEFGGRAPRFGTGRQWGGGQNRGIYCHRCMTLDPMAADPRIGVDAPVLPVQRNNAAPRAV
jgi:hypothetical protein